MQTQVVFSQQSACWVRKNDQAVSVELCLFIAKSKSNRLRSALAFTASWAVLPQKQRWDLPVARANLTGIWRKRISKNGVLLKIPSQERVLEGDACDVKDICYASRVLCAASSLCKSTLYYSDLLYLISSSHHYQGNACCFFLSSPVCPCSWLAVPQPKASQLASSKAGQWWRNPLVDWPHPWAGSVKASSPTTDAVYFFHVFYCLHGRSCKYCLLAFS